MRVHPPHDRSAAREARFAFGGAELLYRDVGRGTPIVALHGGPDFDHQYLLPHLECLADSCRLICYAQRGRGASSGNVRPEDVTLASEIEDLDALRRHLGLESMALLGHSWGGVLAMEYAIRHPERTTHLILVNTGPASHDDYMFLREERRRTAPRDMERLAAASSTPGYGAGDLEADAAYYRIHFGTTVASRDQLEQLVRSLRANFTPEGILKAREIEERLMNETWQSGTYDLLPRLARLRVPALVIHGERDLIPVECARRIAGTIPGARFVLLQGSGHFCHLEAPEAVRRVIVEFLAAHPSPRG
jgi:proline iminopeptidase